MEKIIENKDYEYSQICKLTALLNARYPFLKVSVIGCSVLGKKIFALQIGKGENPVLFAGAFHGSERITGTLLLKFAEELADSLKEGKPLYGFCTQTIFKNKTLIIVPFVNPDGCDIALKGPAAAGARADFIRKISKNNTIKYNANARGVDINHNFPAGWHELHALEQKNGILGPSATRYGSDSPASEIETKTLISLCERISFSHVLAFHSQGEVIYHRYKKHLPKAEKAAELLSLYSGYSLEDPEGLAVGGGFKDYFIDRFSKPGFTIEVGKGENPLPAEALNEIYEKIKEMLIIAIMI